MARHEFVPYLFYPPPTKPTTTTSTIILSISLLSLSQAMDGVALREALVRSVGHRPAALPAAGRCAAR
jgi:hypothetical protein